MGLKSNEWNVLKLETCPSIVGLSSYIIEDLSTPIHVTGHASTYFPVSWVLTIWGCKGWCPGNLPIRKIQDRTTLPVLVQNPPMASVSYPPVLTKESMKMKNASRSHVDHFPLPAKLCLSSPSTMPRPSHTLVISFWHSLAQNILMFSNSCWIAQLSLKPYHLHSYMEKSHYRTCLMSFENARIPRTTFENTPLCAPKYSIVRG